MYPETWLITGGAGYIGAHIAEIFLAAKKQIVLLDNRTLENSERILFLQKKYNLKIPYININIRDFDEIKKVLIKFSIFGIVHTAGLKSVTQSFRMPEDYRQVNYFATKELLRVASENSVKKFIFSSSAAVYGHNFTSILTNEDSETAPLSPYGNSKLLAEKELQNFHSNEGMNCIALRFFNVIGSSSKEMLDSSIENLIPIFYEKLIRNERPVIYGNKFETKDGTCVRDFVDVRDVAMAHLSVADSSDSLPININIGSGKGHSVLEVLSLMKTYMDKINIEPLFLDKREGDSGNLCADITLASKSINFKPLFSFENSIQMFCEYSQLIK